MTVRELIATREELQQAHRARMETEDKLLVSHTHAALVGCFAMSVATCLT